MYTIWPIMDGMVCGERPGDAVTACDFEPARAVSAAAARASERRLAHATLGDRIAEQAYQLDAALHRLLTDVRAFDAAGYWGDAGASSCASWLAWRVGWDSGAAREHVRVARALAELPRIDDALREGRLSYSKVRAITRVATPATEAALLEDARHTTAAQLELICRKLRAVQRLSEQSADDVRARRTVTRRDRDDGMVAIEAVLPPDEAAVVWAAIEHEAAHASGASAPAPAAGGEEAAVDAGAGVERDAPAAPASTCGVSAGTRRRLDRADRADGLVAMCQAALRGEAPERAPVEVVLTIARDALAATATTPASATSVVGAFADGTAVAAETARRLACDCGVVTLTEDAAGNALSVGRRTRSIPAAIARALARRDVTCRFPGCTNRRFLAGHHLTHWIHGGATALANLCRLCPSHHRFVHEHGYRVELRDGEPAFFHRGRQVHGEPPRVIDTTRAWAAIRAGNAAVSIDATTGRCAWDGRPVDYARVVGDLVRLGGER
jgi:hypothetical protein